MVLITNTIALLAILAIIAILLRRYFRERESAQAMLIFAFLLLGANNIGNILNIGGITPILDEYDSIYPIIFLPTLILAIHISSLHSALQLRKKYEKELEMHRISLEDLVKDKTKDLETALDKWKESSVELQKLNKHLSETNSALSESESKYRLLAENANDVIWLYNVDLERYEYISPSLFELSGYTPEEVINLNIFTINTVESGQIQHKMILEHKDKLRQNPEAYAKKIILKEFSLKCKDGQIKWIETSNKFRLNDRNEVELLGITRDISNRRRTEEELRESREKMVEAEKMASLGILTAGIAHELNNPLNFINGAHKAIVSYVEESARDHREKLLPLLDIIDTGLERSVDIVKGLNLFCRSNEANDEACDIHEIIDNCLLMLNNRLKYKAEVHTYFQAKSPLIKGNSGKLHQAFLNILSNAEQAITEKGVIEISTEENKEGINISIVDNGVGIGKEELKHVLSPFYTTKAPGEGTGLGLSITYTIIHNHRGELKIKSVESQGTTVSVYLPYGINIKTSSTDQSSVRDNNS